VIPLPKRFRVHEGCYPHFITSVVTYWIPVFCREDYFAILADSLTFCVEQKGLLIHGYTLMPNHHHLLCSQEEGLLPEAIRDMKGYTSRQIAQKLRQDGRETWLRAMTRKAEGAEQINVWQEEFHPEQVYSQDFFEQKLAYIHENPVRAGFVNNPADWKYSSAGFYYNDGPSPVPVTAILW